MKAESQGGRKGRTKRTPSRPKEMARRCTSSYGAQQSGDATKTKSTEPITVFLSRNAAMIRVQEAERESKSKEARIVFYLSCIVRYLRAQSAKEPESARWVGVLDVRAPYGYKGGLLCENTPICLPTSLSTVLRYKKACFKAQKREKLCT